MGGSESELSFHNPVPAQAAVEEWVDRGDRGLERGREARPAVVFVGRFEAGGRQTVPDAVDFQDDARPEKAGLLLRTLEANLATQPIFASSNKIGGAVAADQANLAVVALVVSWIAIILYLWIRFQGVAFGLAAVVALIHDIFVMLGAVAASIYVAPYLGFLLIEPIKVNLSIVAAFLTIIGYSVNDTIVVFDRIREAAVNILILTLAKWSTTAPSTRR